MSYHPNYVSEQVLGEGGTLYCRYSQELHKTAGVFVNSASLSEAISPSRPLARNIVIHRKVFFRQKRVRVLCFYIVVERFRGARTLLQLHMDRFGNSNGRIDFPKHRTPDYVDESRELFSASDVPRPLLKCTFSIFETQRADV